MMIVKKAGKNHLINWKKISGKFFSNIEPHNKPLPATLVKKLVKARMKENEERIVAKKRTPGKSGKTKFIDN